MHQEHNGLFFSELKDEVDLLYSCGIVCFSSFINDIGEERVH